MPISTEAPLPPTFEIGKLKVVVDVSLPMSTLQFFQIFVGEQASDGLPAFHKEFGDEDVVASGWIVGGEDKVTSFWAFGALVFDKLTGTNIIIYRSMTSMISKVGKMCLSDW